MSSPVAAYPETQVSYRSKPKVAPKVAPRQPKAEQAVNQVATRSPPKVAPKPKKPKKQASAPDKNQNEILSGNEQDSMIVNGGCNTSTEDLTLQTSAIYVHDNMVKMYVVAPDDKSIEAIETTTEDTSIEIHAGEPEVVIKSPRLNRASQRFTNLSFSSNSSSPGSPRNTGDTSTLSLPSKREKSELQANGSPNFGKKTTTLPNQDAPESVKDTKIKNKDDLNSSVESLDFYDESFKPATKMDNAITAENVQHKEDSVKESSSFSPPSFVSSVPKPKVLTRSQLGATRNNATEPTDSPPFNKPLTKPRAFVPGALSVGLPRPYVRRSETYSSIRDSWFKSPLGNHTNQYATPLENRTQIQLEEKTSPSQNVLQTVQDDENKPVESDSRDDLSSSFERFSKKEIDTFVNDIKDFANVEKDEQQSDKENEHVTIIVQTVSTAPLKNLDDLTVQQASQSESKAKVPKKKKKVKSKSKTEKDDSVAKNTSVGAVIVPITTKEVKEINDYEKDVTPVVQEVVMTKVTEPLLYQDSGKDSKEANIQLQARKDAIPTVQEVIMTKTTEPLLYDDGDDYIQITPTVKRKRSKSREKTPSEQPVPVVQPVQKTEHNILTAIESSVIQDSMIDTTETSSLKKKKKKASSTSGKRKCKKEKAAELSIQSLVEPVIQNSVEPVIQSSVEPMIQVAAEPVLQVSAETENIKKTFLEEPLIQRIIEPVVQTSDKTVVQKTDELVTQSQLEPVLQDLNKQVVLGALEQVGQCSAVPVDEMSSVRRSPEAPSTQIKAQIDENISEVLTDLNVDLQTTVSPIQSLILIEPEVKTPTSSLKKKKKKKDSLPAPMGQELQSALQTQEQALPKASSNKKKKKEISQIDLSQEGQTTEAPDDSDKKKKKRPRSTSRKRKDGSKEEPMAAIPSLAADAVHMQQRLEESAQDLQTIQPDTQTTNITDTIYIIKNIPHKPEKDTQTLLQSAAPEISIDVTGPSTISVVDDEMRGMDSGSLYCERQHYVDILPVDVSQPHISLQSEPFTETIQSEDSGLEISQAGPQSEVPAIILTTPSTSTKPGDDLTAPDTYKKKKKKAKGDKLKKKKSQNEEDKEVEPITSNSKELKAFVMPVLPTPEEIRAPVVTDEILHSLRTDIQNLSQAEEAQQVKDYSVFTSKKKKSQNEEDKEVEPINSNSKELKAFVMPVLPTPEEIRAPVVTDEILQSLRTDIQNLSQAEEAQQVKDYSVLASAVDTSEVPIEVLSGFDRSEGIFSKHIEPEKQVSFLTSTPMIQDLPLEMRATIVDVDGSPTTLEKTQLTFDDSQIQDKSRTEDSGIKKPKVKNDKKRTDSSERRKSKKKDKINLPSVQIPNMASVQISQPDMTPEKDPWADEFDIGLSQATESAKKTKMKKKKKTELSGSNETTSQSLDLTEPPPAVREEVVYSQIIKSPKKKTDFFYESTEDVPPPLPTMSPIGAPPLPKTSPVGVPPLPKSSPVGVPPLPKSSPVGVPPLPKSSPVGVPPLPKQPPVAEAPSEVKGAKGAIVNVRPVDGVYAEIIHVDEPIVVITPAKRSKYPPRTVSMPPDKPQEATSQPDEKVPVVISDAKPVQIRKSALKKSTSSERVKSGSLDTSADTLDGSTNGEAPKKKVAIALPHQATPDVKARLSSLFTFEDGPPSPNQTPDQDPSDPIMADVVAAQENVDVEGPLQDKMKDRSGPILLSYIDFFPGRTGRSNFKYKFASFDVLVDRANIWLEKNSDFRVLRCETVEYKKRSDEEGNVDSDTATFREFGSRENKYIKALRLWVAERTSEDPAGPDFIGYFNVLPDRLDTSKSAKKAKFATLTQTLQRMNERIRGNPIPGKILNVEHQELKLFEPGDHMEPDRNYWVEAGTGHVFVTFLRIFFTHGRPAFEDLECVDFVPRITRNSKTLGKCEFEPLQGAVTQARDWLYSRRRTYGRVVSIQSLNFRAKHHWGNTPPDTIRMIFEEKGGATYLVRFIRLTLTKVYQSEDIGPTPVPKTALRLYHKSFRPVLLTKKGMCSKISFESLSQTQDRVLAWIKAAKCQIFSVETSTLRIRGGAKTMNADETCQVLTEDDDTVLYIIRIFLDGPFVEPSKDDLPPVPDAITDGPCCVVS